MRSIGVATFARSDYSSCLPIMRAIQADPGLELHTFVAGMHLSPEFGQTLKHIEADGFVIHERIEMLLSSDTPEGIAQSIGLGAIGFAHRFTRFRPDILLLVGDRFELLSAVCAALPFTIPIAHVSGGDITEGAIDNQVRHAISKMSHLHFVAMQIHADRLIQMGEEPWRVLVTGDPALDLLRHMRWLSRTELSESLGLELSPPILVITFHPTTLGATPVSEEINNLLAALGRVQGTLVFSYPNADAHSRVIVERLRAFVDSRPGSGLYQNLGQLQYYSLLSYADLMLGNSSSGIWEAPSFYLPVVNIGDRQRGRLRAGNVIDVPAEAESIYAAIQRGLDPAFRAALNYQPNPYGDGQAAARIVKALRNVELDACLLRKKFIDFDRTSQR
jgi:UDP-hydrolysing UDP-N-acetyl-D-glucosamine 2-epimerase